jgi:hypothetical protein
MLLVGATATMKRVLLWPDVWGTSVVCTDSMMLHKLSH